MLDGGSRTPAPARGGLGGRVRLRRLANRPERRSGRVGFRAPPHAGQRGADGAGHPPSPLLQGLLFALAVALAGFTVLQGIAPHDEGLMLQAGARIASGEWPYRDFWINYPPGQPLVLALLQRAFGPSLLSWRILLLALDGRGLGARLAAGPAARQRALGAGRMAGRGRRDGLSRTARGPTRRRSRSCSPRCWRPASGPQLGGRSGRGGVPVPDRVRAGRAASRSR